MKNKSWKAQKKAEFLGRLGKMLDEGYTLSDGIDFLKYHQKQEVRDILEYLLIRLREGEPFHEILADIGFPGDVLGYLYFSEQHGDLSFALIESGKMMERREEMKARFQKLIRYPIFLLWLVVVLVVFMTNYLFPQFRSLYESLDLDFPWFTGIFLTLITYAPLLIMGVLVLLILAFLYYLFRFRYLHPLRQVSTLMRLPILHSFLPIMITQYFSVQMSCLIRGGLSIYESLLIFEKQSHLAFFQQEAVQIKIALKKGERFDDVLRQKPFYAKELSEIVSHGQTNGNLGRELFHYSNLLSEMIENKISRIFAMVQPALFAGIGAIVLAMFVSILLPIFHLMNAM